MNGVIGYKKGKSQEALRKRIRQTLLKEFGRYDDNKINLKEINSGKNGNKIFEGLNHL